MPDQNGVISDSPTTQPPRPSTCHPPLVATRGTNSTSSGPVTVSRHVATRDISTQFHDAASALRIGQLVKDEFFTLFESVGALEIMDSKMDSGHSAFGEPLEEDYNTMMELLPEELIWIMDQLLCHEMAWQMGHPLSQTLFTSVYINRLLWPVQSSLDNVQLDRGRQSSQGDPLIHRVLRSYCLGTIKSCDFVLRMVSSEHYYEEEDFATQLFHRDLLTQCDSLEIHSLLQDAILWLASTSMDPKHKSALGDRLMLRQELLLGLEEDTAPFGHNRHVSSSCIPFLRGVKGSTSLGKPVEDAFTLKIQRSLASSVPPRPMVKIGYAEAFSHLEKDCHDRSDMSELFAITGNDNLLTAYWIFMSRKPQPSVYIRALLQSFLSRGDKVLEKFSLKSFIYSDLEALVLPNSPLLDEANEKVEPPSDPRFQVAKHLNDFVTRCGQPYLNIFRTACLNRCRVRRILCHAVVEWDNLQADAEKQDTTLRNYTEESPAEYLQASSHTYSYPLSSWVYHYKLYQLGLVVQMGFELCVYAPDEFAGMYWLLSHICLTHISHLDRIGFFVERQGEERSSFTRPQGYLGNPVIDHRVRIERTLTYLFRIYTRLKATEALARALQALYVVLARHGALAKPPRPYSSDKLRYELRMKPLLSLSVPEPVSFDEFGDQSSLSGADDLSIIEDASKSIDEARKTWDQVLKSGWRADLTSRGALLTDIRNSHYGTEGRATATLETEWVKDVKDTLRACIAASIAIGTVKKRVANGPRFGQPGVLNDLNVQIPGPHDKDCWHRWWIVPKITER